MSILVKGMAMPKKCLWCPLQCIGFCQVTKTDVISGLGRRADNCPLVELPEKHGRLIDADAMCNDLATVDPQYETMIDWCIRVTEAQPTVIEAEDEG